MEKIMSRPDLSAMKEGWSSGIVARQEIRKFSGGVLTAKYMEWLDSQGKGPKNSVRMGRKVAYSVGELILWLESRSSFVDVDGENETVHDRSNLAHSKEVPNDRAIS